MAAHPWQRSSRLDRIDGHPDRVGGVASGGLAGWGLLLKTCHRRAQDSKGLPLGLVIIQRRRSREVEQVGPVTAPERAW